MQPKSCFVGVSGNLIISVLQFHHLNSKHPALPLKCAGSFLKSLTDTLLREQQSTMPKVFSCEDRRCNEKEKFHDLGETIEHLRNDHKLSFIKRPFGLGVSDSHGHVWYCFQCNTDFGKDHRSYQSDQAMWDHLNNKHDHQFSVIEVRE